MSKTTDLTTVDRVRAIGRVRSKGEDDDTRLDLFVSAASDAVRDYTRRDYLFLTAPEGYDPDASSPKTFEYNGGGYLSLDPFEARAIVSVTVDGTALDAGDWRVGPRQGTREGTFLYLDGLDALSGDDTAVDVDVVAKWGIVDLPSVVELATIDTVVDWFSNPQGARSRTFEGVALDDDGGVGYERGALPLRARLLLEAHRR